MEKLNLQLKEKVSWKAILKFVVPSLLGILFMMIPFSKDGATTILVSVLSSYLNRFLQNRVPIHYLVLGCITVSVVLPLVYKWTKAKCFERFTVLKELADIHWFWIFVRFLGLIFTLSVIFQWGAKPIFSENTGSLVLFDLIASLFTIFFMAGFVLPFLTDFGLLEYVGVFLTKVMRPVFDLPGRSAVDCVASWIGDGTIGVALTSKQYEQGHYTEKEAAVISTAFSAVSITFCLVVVQNVGLTDYFAPFYFTVFVAGVACAWITPKLPPLSWKKSTYLKDGQKQHQEMIPEGYTQAQWALKLATDKAATHFSLKKFFGSGVSTVLYMWIGVVPVIMTIGTLALMLSEYTPIFSYLGMPFVPVLELLQVQEALAASQTLVVGFADMVVPSILAASIQSAETRFIIAALSVCQLIYMSETGSVILGSKIPVKLHELFVIFMLRTLIALPIIILLAKIFF